MRKVIVSFVLVAVLCGPAIAKKKQKRPYEEPGPTLTTEESKAAYDASIKELKAILKAPWAAVLPPIEGTKIWSVIRNVSYNPNPVTVIKVMFEFIGQNSFGALEKRQAICIMPFDSRVPLCEELGFIPGLTQ